MLNKSLFSKKLGFQPQDNRTLRFSGDYNGPTSPLLGIVGVAKGPRRISYKEQGMLARKKEIEKITELCVTNITKAQDKDKVDDPNTVRKQSASSISALAGRASNLGITLQITDQTKNSRCNSIDTQGNMILRKSTLKQQDQNTHGTSQSNEGLIVESNPNQKRRSEMLIVSTTQTKSPKRVLEQKQRADYSQFARIKNRALGHLQSEASLPRQASIESSREKSKEAPASCAKPDTVETQNGFTGPKSATGSVPKTYSNKVVQKSVDNDASISHLESTSSIPLDVRLPKMDDEINSAKRAKTVDNRKPQNERLLSELKEYQDTFRNENNGTLFRRSLERSDKSPMLPKNQDIIGHDTNTVDSKELNSPALKAVLIEPSPERQIVKSSAVRTTGGNSYDSAMCKCIQVNHSSLNSQFDDEEQKQQYAHFNMTDGWKPETVLFRRKQPENQLVTPQHPLFQQYIAKLEMHKSQVQSKSYGKYMQSTFSKTMRPRQTSPQRQTDRLKSVKNSPVMVQEQKTEPMANEEVFTAGSPARSASPERDQQAIRPKVHSVNFEKQRSPRKCTTSMNLVRKPNPDIRIGPPAQLQRLPHGFVVSNASIKQKLNKETFSRSQPDRILGNKLSLARKRVQAALNQSQGAQHLQFAHLHEALTDPNNKDMDFLANQSIRQLGSQKQDFEMRVGSVVEFNLDFPKEQKGAGKINRCMSANTTAIGGRRRAQRQKSHLNASLALQPRNAISPKSRSPKSKNTQAPKPSHFDHLSTSQGTRIDKSQIQLNRNILITQELSPSKIMSPKVATVKNNLVSGNISTEQNTPPRQVQKFHKRTRATTAVGPHVQVDIQRKEVLRNYNQNQNQFVRTPFSNQLLSGDLNRRINNFIGNFGQAQADRSQNFEAVLGAPKDYMQHQSIPTTQIKSKRALVTDLRTRAQHANGSFHLYHRGHLNSFTSPRNIFYELSVAQARQLNMQRYQDILQQQPSSLQVTTKKVHRKGKSAMTIAHNRNKTSQLKISDEDILSDNKINLLIQEASSLALLDASLTQALEMTSKGVQRNNVRSDLPNANLTEGVDKQGKRKLILGDFSDGRSVSMTSDHTQGQTALQNATSTLMRESTDYKTSKVPAVPPKSKVSGRNEKPHTQLRNKNFKQSSYNHPLNQN